MKYYRWKSRKSYASNPGRLKISNEKWKQMEKIFRLNIFQRIDLIGAKIQVASHIYNGDVQPAIVVSTSPLIISAYSDEMDAVVMLKFPEEYAKIYKLEVGSKLITINRYKVQFYFAKDILVGRHYLGRDKDFLPIIPLFFTKNENRCYQMVELFDENL